MPSTGTIDLTASYANMDSLMDGVPAPIAR